MRLAIPFGDNGLTVDASPEAPKIITAVDDDLVVQGQPFDAPLFAGSSVRVTQPTVVRRSDGHVSIVDVRAAGLRDRSQDDEAA